MDQPGKMVGGMGRGGPGMGMMAGGLAAARKFKGAAQPEFPGRQAMTMPLPGSAKILVIPAEGDRATVIDAGTNDRVTYRAPAGTSQIIPVIGGSVLGLQLKGPHMTQVVAYSRTENRWYPFDLKESPADGLANPVVSATEVRYYIGHHLYFFNDTHKRWSVLTLQLPMRAGSTSAPGETHDGERTFITEGDVMHIYDPKVGDWTQVDLKDDK